VARRRAFPDVAADLRLVFARLRSSPLRVGASTFDLAAAQDTLRVLLRVPEAAARVPLILHAAAAGDYRELLAANAALRYGGALTARQLMYWAIVCGEGWARLDATEVRRWGTGTEFVESSLDQAQTLQVVCPLLGEPLPAPDTGVAPKSRVPVLFLVGGMDPQDPLENVAAAPQPMPNAQILVVPGAGHGSVQYGCLPTVAAHFFTTHRLSKPDKACAASVLPPPFASS
jgi:pimeloyl-ACP methyl ester carboxylesterase